MKGEGRKEEEGGRGRGTDDNASFSIETKFSRASQQCERKPLVLIGRKANGGVRW